MSRNMWTIGIKSGLMTILGFIAYGQVVQLMGLKYSLWGNLGPLVLALGIYSGHYYYKLANGGWMTYKQGLKLGLVVVSFVGLVSTLPLYLYIKFMGASFSAGFAEGVSESIQKTLQRENIDQAIIEEVVQSIQQMAPEFFVIFVFSGTVLLGFACTLVIAAFSKHSKKITQQP